MNDCGCWHDHMNDEIKYCPMHKAAPDLLAALKEVSHARPTRYAEGDGTDPPFIIYSTTLDKVKQAIAKVEGQPNEILPVSRRKQP